jgi:hypothetical protein
VTSSGFTSRSTRHTDSTNSLNAAPASSPKGGSDRSVSLATSWNRTSVL